MMYDYRTSWDLTWEIEDSSSSGIHASLKTEYHSISGRNTMVRRIHLVLDNDEFAKLLVLKGNKTWKDFFIEPHVRGKKS